MYTDDWYDDEDEDFDTYDHPSRYSDDEPPRLNFDTAVDLLLTAGACVLVIASIAYMLHMILLGFIR